MVIGAVVCNLLSIHEYLNSSLTFFSNFTQLSAVTTCYSAVSEKLLPVEPQHDLQVSWSKVWFGDLALELPGQQKLEAIQTGRGREGCWLLGGTTSSSCRWPLFCWKKYHPGTMLPRIRNIRWTSNFRAPNITICLAHGNGYRKGEREDDWRERFPGIYGALLGVWKAKNMITTSSSGVKMGFRYGIIYQIWAQDRSKCAV